MQQGIEYIPYSRIESTKIDKDEKKISIKDVIHALTYFIFAILISRVFLINYIAPFGIAFIMAVSLNSKLRYTVIVTLGAIGGYLSLILINLASMEIYIALSITILIISALFNESSKFRKITLFVAALLVEFIVYQICIGGTLFTSILQGFILLGITMVLFYIFSYALKGVDKFEKTGSLSSYTNENIISSTITIAIGISGIGLNIFDVSTRNILAFFLILVVSYVKGSSFGASLGILLGVIIGMSNSSVVNYIGVYGLCGLIAGLFRQYKKVFSAITFLLAFTIIKLYSNIGSFKIIECIIAIIIFLIIKDSYYQGWIKELVWENQKDDSGKNGEKFKNIILNRLDSLTKVLYNISNVIKEEEGVANLPLKDKSTFLVEMLADRICSECSLSTSCWKGEAYFTYNSFTELIQSFQEKRFLIPKELCSRCIKRDLLKKATEEILENYNIKELCRNRLEEGKLIMASQINSMASSINQIVYEIGSNIYYNEEIELKVKKLLDKNNIIYSGLFCIEDKSGRLFTNLNIEHCGGRQYCAKTILPLINIGLGRNMCITEESCKVDKTTNTCRASFKETPKYFIISSGESLNKAGEDYCGDNYSFNEQPDGSYMILLCDGMGSGPRANQESNAAMKLIESFTKEGFSKESAIKVVNSVMTMKYSLAENFSTVDLASIDLYTGEVDFMKIGAVDSYIKRGKEIIKISSRSLPIGVLDKVEADIIKKVVSNGDLVIMLSDGISDTFKEPLITAKGPLITDLEEFISESIINSPKEMAKEILKEALSLSGGIAKDDMTVLVAKVYTLY
ncbi:MAG TPA: stage II sporulation protein E [Clostridiaceae bacterium]